MIAWIFTSCSHFAVPVIRLRSHTDFPHTLRWVLCGNIQKPIVPSLSLNLLLVPSLALCMSVYVSVSRAEVKRIFFFWEPFFSETWINEDWDFLLLFISTCWSPTESFWNKVLIRAKLSRYSPDWLLCACLLNREANKNVVLMSHLYFQYRRGSFQLLKHLCCFGLYIDFHVTF